MTGDTGLDTTLLPGQDTQTTQLYYKEQGGVAAHAQQVTQLLRPLQTASGTETKQTMIQQYHHKLITRLAVTHTRDCKLHTTLSSPGRV